MIDSNALDNDFPNTTDVCVIFFENIIINDPSSHLEVILPYSL